MLIDEIRRTPAKVLTEEQRESYWKNGYLLLERLIPEEWLERLRAATDEMVERSRALTASDRVFDLEPDHTAAEPRLRRVTSPVDQHPDYWAYARGLDELATPYQFLDRTIYGRQEAWEDSPHGWPQDIT